MVPVTDPVTDHDPLLAIGALSRASGLTVSALRFYDRQGLLVPAEVDPATGYRRYSPAQSHQARLLAGMRRVGMPLAEMAAVLESLPDTAAAQDLLDAHLRRLEGGLVDARREIARLTGILPGPRSHPLQLTVPAAALARALDAVRYAASGDPDFPMLCAVLLEPHSEGLRLVATDRYRLAVAEVEGAPAGHPAGRMALLPTALADRLRAGLAAALPGAAPSGRVLPGTAQVRLQVSPARVTAQLPGGAEVSGACLDLDFPDYRRLLRSGHPADATGPQVAVADILSGLAGRSEPRVRLGPDGVTRCPDDTVSGAPDDSATGVPDGLLLDRAFLWEAASALGEGVAVLPAAGEIAPLALRHADGTVRSLVMPVRPKPDRPGPACPEPAP